MITVKLLGGIKKIFEKDLLNIELDAITINALLKYLLKIKPTNTIEIDTKNILVAVNGVDSSALEGYQTILHSGDVISIIPVIHGGEPRFQFKVRNTNVELFHISNSEGKNYEFLDRIRKKFPKLMLEGISSNSILSITHVKKILALSIFAQKNNILLSKKLETDILLRFAATTQISFAINLVGIEQQKNFTIIGMGKKSSLIRLHEHLKPYLQEPNYSQNSKYLKKQFGISKEQLDSVDSKTALEDLLVEKAAVLIQ